MYSLRKRQNSNVFILRRKKKTTSMNSKFELMAEPRDVATRDCRVSANAWIGHLWAAGVVQQARGILAGLHTPSAQALKLKGHQLSTSPPRPPGHDTGASTEWSVSSAHMRSSLWTLVTTPRRGAPSPAACQVLLKETRRGRLNGLHPISKP